MVMTTKPVVMVMTTKPVVKALLPNFVIIVI